MTDIPRQTQTHLSTEDLKPHLENIREGIGSVAEMIQSIQQHGILQPLVVTEHPVTKGAYLILAGHRRHAAATKLGIPKVPCVIRHDQGSDTDAHIALMFTENTHRKQLTPIEKTRAIERLLDGGRRSFTEVAAMTGISPSAVSKHLVLGDADPQTQADVEAGRVTASAAREAVMNQRKRERQAAGHRAAGRPATIEPPHLSPRHPLATTVKKVCRHVTRPRVGAIGCGQCWEQAIRDDERTKAEGRR